MRKKMSWGKKHNKIKNEKITHNKEKKSKKRRSKNQGKKHCSGETLLQSTILCMRNYTALSTPFTVHIT